jgi:hypothetical protein
VILTLPLYTFIKFEFVGQRIQNQENHWDDDLVQSVAKKDVNEGPHQKEHHMNNLS